MTLALVLMVAALLLTIGAVASLIYVALALRSIKRATNAPNAPRHAVAADDDVLDAWPFYSRAARRRMVAGRVEYGDRSFSRHPTELLDELAEEALDMGGWGYVLWHRIQQAREAAERIDTREE